VSPEGRSVRRGGWAMNEILDFYHNAAAELIARRWREDRPYFTLTGKARGAWLEGSRSLQSENGALTLHWARRSHAIPMQIRFPRMALQEPELR
jgi:hypothetical protein